MPDPRNLKHVKVSLMTTKDVIVGIAALKARGQKSCIGRSLPINALGFANSLGWFVGISGLTYPYPQVIGATPLTRAVGSVAVLQRGARPVV
jgi:hypothetical protein